MLTEPQLSILIPSYNYHEGVLRIVLPLLAENRSDIEILVHDDSGDDSVEACMRELSASHPCLSYVRNFPALGAVNNWNNLLKSARGRYAMLIHHDDFPLSETFASDLLIELEKNAWPDAIMLSCLAYDVARKKIKPCICNPIRSFIVRHRPSYLFRRNVVGPPSVLVVRRELFEGYDPELKWLVDVEAYFRFLTTKPRRLFSSRLMMVSSTGLPDAISTTIRGSAKEIADAELAYIAAKLPETKNLAYGSLFEKMLWMTIKTTSLLSNIIMPTTAYSEILHRDHTTLASDHPQERTIDVA